MKPNALELIRRDVCGSAWALADLAEMPANHGLMRVSVFCGRAVAFVHTENADSTWTQRGAYDAHQWPDELGPAVARLLEHAVNETPPAERRLLVAGVAERRLELVAVIEPDTGRASVVVHNGTRSGVVSLGELRALEPELTH